MNINSNKIIEKNFIHIFSANYCGGCKAEWFVNGKKVDCSAPTKQAKMECDPANCFVEPCLLATCSKYPNATCV